MDNKALNFSFAPEFKNVDMVRGEMAKLCSEMYAGDGIDSLVGDFCLAATEAMNNAVEHSGADRIAIEFTAAPEGMTIRISNDGAEFDPTGIISSMPERDEDGDLPEGGFGLALIRELVDSVSYEYSGGMNVWTLKKNIQRQ